MHSDNMKKIIEEPERLDALCGRVLNLRKGVGIGFNSILDEYLSKEEIGSLIDVVKQKKDATVMDGILNYLWIRDQKKRVIEEFGKILREDKDFAYLILDNVDSQKDIFQYLFRIICEDSLSEKYISHALSNTLVKPIVGVLRVIAIENAKIMFKELIEQDMGYSYKILNSIDSQSFLHSSLTRVSEEYMWEKGIIDFQSSNPLTAQRLPSQASEKLTHIQIRNLNQATDYSKVN